MTHEELILECLRVGLDGEKADYEWDKREDQSVLVKFEDGKRVRAAVQEVAREFESSSLRRAGHCEPYSPWK